MIVSGAPVHDGEGFLLLPDQPGIGVELRPEAARAAHGGDGTFGGTFTPREVVTRLGIDGSVVDQ